MLGQVAATQPIAAAQQYGLANAVQPSILALIVSIPGTSKPMILASTVPSRNKHKMATGERKCISSSRITPTVHKDFAAP